MASLQGVGNDRRDHGRGGDRRGGGAVPVEANTGVPNHGGVGLAVRLAIVDTAGVGGAVVGNAGTGSSRASGRTVNGVRACARVIVVTLAERGGAGSAGIGCTHEQEPSSGAAAGHKRKHECS